MLPKILLQIVYYDADDEFPFEVQILFDKNASRFMEFECLAFLEGCLVRAMIMTAKTGDTAGWVNTTFSSRTGRTGGLPKDEIIKKSLEWPIVGRK